MSDSVSAIGTQGTQPKHHHTAAQRAEYQAAKQDEQTDTGFQQYAQANQGQGVPLSTLYANYQAQQADGTGPASSATTQMASADPTGAASSIASNTLGSLTPTPQASA